MGFGWQEIDKALDLGYIRVAGLHRECKPAVLFEPPNFCPPHHDTYSTVKTVFVVCIHAYVCIYAHTCVCAYIGYVQSVYVHTYTYVLTYLRTYVRTCMHAYICMTCLH